MVNQAVLSRDEDVAQWKSDEELFGWIRKELSTPPVSDVMEQLGFRYPMLPAQIRPLRSDMVLIGRAMPVQDELPVEYGEPSRFDAKPFGLLFESIEALRPNEVYIASGGPTHVARLGDMLVMRAQNLGAAGVVLNAHLRDGNGNIIPELSRFRSRLSRLRFAAPPQCSGFSLFDHNRQGAGQTGRSDLWRW